LQVNAHRLSQVDQKWQEVAVMMIGRRQEKSLEANTSVIQGAPRRMMRRF
jgi:hypothetical protein